MWTSPSFHSDSSVQRSVPSPYVLSRSTSGSLMYWRPNAALKSGARNGPRTYQFPNTGAFSLSSSGGEGRGEEAVSPPGPSCTLPEGGSCAGPSPRFWRWVVEPLSPTPSPLVTRGEREEGSALLSSRDAPVVSGAARSASTSKPVKTKLPFSLRAALVFGRLSFVNASKRTPVIALSGVRNKTV